MITKSMEFPTQGDSSVRLYHCLLPVSEDLSGLFPLTDLPYCLCVCIFNVFNFL